MAVEVARLTGDRTSRARRASLRGWVVGQAAQVRVRVTVAATLAALVAAVLGSVLFVNLLEANLEQSLQSSAASQIETVEAQLEQGASDQEAVVSGKQDIFVQIVDPAGKVLGTDHRRVTSPVRTATGRDENVHVPGLDDAYAVLAERTRGGNLIVVGRSEEQVARATSVTTTLLLISVPVGLVAIALVVWLSIGRALRPVEAMRRQAAVITSEHLHRRLQVPPGHDEIPRLSSTLNEMLDRVDTAHQRQRQFVSDASHELRSPLSALRQVAEVARRYPDRVESSALAHDVLLEETRMEELVTALLTLARLDDGAGAAGVHGAVDLDDLVLEEVARVSGTEVAIDVSGVSSGQVVGNPVLLRQIVRNLLSNALRHARRHVVITLVESGDRVLLEVADDGAGIAAEDREAVFERFVRLDEARTRDAGGSGLGLAIVRKVTEALGGSVVVQDGRLGGACFTVDLPGHVGP